MLTSVAMSCEKNKKQIQLKSTISLKERGSKEQEEIFIFLQNNEGENEHLLPNKNIYI